MNIPRLDWRRLFQIAAHIRRRFVIGDNLQRRRRQHAGLYGFDVLGWRTQPFLQLSFASQHDRHRLRVDRTHELIGVGRQEAEQLVRTDVGLLLGPLVAFPLAPDACKTE